MAGHPTIGTTFALAALGVIPRGRARWVFGLNVGPTAVALEWGDDGLTTAWMDQGRPEFRAAGRAGWPTSSPPSTAIRRRGRPPACRSRKRRAARRSSTCRWLDACGGRCVRSRRREDAPPAERVPRGARRRVRVHGRSRAQTGPPSTAGCSRRRPASSRIRPPAGPAVRSAATWCATASCRWRQGSHIVSAQGVKMGRPSRIHVRVEATSPADITRVHVGGSARRASAMASVAVVAAPRTSRPPH